MKMKNQKPKNNQKTNLTPKSPTATQPFIVHVRELRQRLIYIVLALVVFGALGYFIQEQVINLLLRPAQGQQFIYTTPGGGFNFLVSICVYVGIAGSVPLIMYHLFRFLEPLIPDTSHRFITRCGFLSVLLAVLGACFGYFVGLPAALAFLLNQFQTTQIQPLLTIQEYISFVMIYIIGFALLFQIPLILLFINRITRLRPRKLFGYQRFVIAGAFAAAAIITPSGDAVNQLIMAVPIIAMYQFGVAGVWFYNYRSNYDAITARRAEDAVIQNTRQSQYQAPQPLTAGRATNTSRPTSPASPSKRWLDVQPPPVRLRASYFEDIRRVAG